MRSKHVFVLKMDYKQRKNLRKSFHRQIKYTPNLSKNDHRQIKRTSNWIIFPVAKLNAKICMNKVHT